MIIIIINFPGERFFDVRNKGKISDGSLGWWDGSGNGVRGGQGMITVSEHTYVYQPNIPEVVWSYPGPSKVVYPDPRVQSKLSRRELT